MLLGQKMLCFFLNFQSYKRNKNLILLKDELHKLKLRKPDHYRKSEGENEQATTVEILLLCMIINYKDVL